MTRVVGGREERWLLKSASVVISVTVDMIAGQLFVAVGFVMCSLLGLVIKYELIKLTEIDRLAELCTTPIFD
jgi:hypothetical protein